MTKKLGHFWQLSKTPHEESSKRTGLTSLCKLDNNLLVAAFSKQPSSDENFIMHSGEPLTELTLNYNLIQDESPFTFRLKIN